MTNQEIARRFQQIADISEIQGENPFKVRAYRKAVETIYELEDSLADIAARNGLADLPGFGEAIIGKTQDFLTKGTTNLWDRLKDAVPMGVVAMAAIPGVGPKSAKALWEALDVKSVEELETAARAGRVQKVAGFGATKEKNLIEAIERYRRLNARVPRYIALQVISQMAKELAKLPHVISVEFAGELRRGCDSILLASEDDEPVLPFLLVQTNNITDTFQRLDSRDPYGIVGPRSVILLESEDLNGLVPIKLTVPAVAGLDSLVATGPHSFVTKLDSAATQSNQTTEEAIFEGIGLPFIAPELRDWPDIIDRAKRGELPTLVTEADFKGQLHEHSRYSDGAATIREMAEAAIARGYEYLAITDHSRSLVIANGMPRERHLQQLDEIAALNREYAGRFTLLAGIEADILADGSLDCDEDILQRLDIVVGSVHIRYKETEEAMTKRVVTALENPYLTLLGHPTGRLIGRREPFAVDMDAVIAAAKANHKILEINASPDRMDLKDVYARQAKEAGVKITVNADAHSPAGLDLLPWGLCMARRAGLTADDVINTYPLARLLPVLKRSRGVGT